MFWRYSWYLQRLQYDGYHKVNLAQTSKRREGALTQYSIQRHMSTWKLHKLETTWRQSQ